MRKIRNKTFETNSSSTHCIAIPRNNPPSSRYLDRIVFSYDCYGWEFECRSFHDYLWTAILCFNESYESGWIEYTHSLEEWEEKIRKVLENDFSTIIFEYPEEGSYYYIDHDSELKDLLETLWNDEELLRDSILSGMVYTGNDNADDYYREDMYDFEKEQEELGSFVYYKGN